MQVQDVVHLHIYILPRFENDNVLNSLQKSSKLASKKSSN